MSACLVKKARNFKIAQMALTTTRLVTMITDGLLSQIRYNNSGTQKCWPYLPLCWVSWVSCSSPHVRYGWQWCSLHCWTGRGSYCCPSMRCQPPWLRAGGGGVRNVFNSIFPGTKDYSNQCFFKGSSLRPLSLYTTFYLDNYIRITTSWHHFDFSPGLFPGTCNYNPLTLDIVRPNCFIRLYLPKVMLQPLGLDISLSCILLFKKIQARVQISFQWLT